jgi:malate dehydrogenase (oxaloacetate-decarboxylating)
MSRAKDRLADAEIPAREAMRLHPLYRGKIQMMPKCPIRGGEDFAIWYTPGVAAPCRAIRESPELVYEHTNKANTIAVVSDGSRVLGLGNIGPEAGLPVMEGKALLFKYLGGVDAVPLCLASQEPDDIVRTVQLVAPSFGGINLEDIAQPKCFRVLDALRDDLGIPVWHDDQQGTATAVAAGLMNALKVVGKELSQVRIVMFGMGAANVSVYRLLTDIGVEPQAIVACDSKGILGRGRHDIEETQDTFYDKWQVCTHSNPDGLAGDPAQAFKGADVCIAFSRSGPNIIAPDWIETMAQDAVVFACANPVPEIWPWDAEAAGVRIVATGRSDFPNQLNNSLVFPGVFRGVLDVRATAITGEMAFAAALALAGYAEVQGLEDAHILPRMDDWEVAAAIAAATGEKAQEQGIARTSLSHGELFQLASETIGKAREAVNAISLRLNDVSGFSGT